MVLFLLKPPKNPSCPAVLNRPPGFRWDAVCSCELLKPITFPTVLLESWVACKPQLCCVVGHQIARISLKTTLFTLPSLAVVVVNMHFLFPMVTFLGFLVFYSFHVNFRICLLLFRVRVNIWKQVLRVVYGCH